MFAQYLFEIFLIFRTSSSVILNISWHYLVQDKFCMNVYNQTEHFCQQIHTIKTNDTRSKIRDHVLASAAKYTQVHHLMEFVPVFVWVLFVGAFVDKRPNAAKYILMLHIFAEVLQNILYLLNEYYFEWSPYLMLMSSLPIGLSGGLATFLTLAYRVVVFASSEEDRPVRFMLVQFGIVIGGAMGSTAGGYLLKPTNLGEEHSEIRTYQRNFYASLGINALSFVLLFVALRFNRPFEEEKQLVEKDEESVDAIQPPPPLQEEPPKKNILRELFDLDNVRQNITCLLQPRQEYQNLQIWLIYAMYFCSYFVFMGKDGVLLQFCEKVYGWNAAKYSNIAAINRVVSTAVVFVTVFLFIKKLRVDDTKLIFVSVVIAEAAYLAVGVHLHELTYFISMPFSAISGLAFVCMRNRLTDIVPRNEIGRIFALISMIQAVVPLVSSLAYANLFAAVVTTHPGWLYLFSAAVYSICVGITIFEQLHCRTGFLSRRSTTAMISSSQSNEQLHNPSSTN